jgi:hypothetical protein
MSMIVGLFFLRGTDLLSDGVFDVLKQVLMPWYLIFCGIMLGYILARINIWYTESTDDHTKIYTKFFTIGIGIGIVLAFVYIIL